MERVLSKLSNQFFPSFVAFLQEARFLKGMLKSYQYEMKVILTEIIVDDN